jgi:EAL domain-containing protein (putative c-di-GMP-specific phosphodiesterase class I)
MACAGYLIFSGRSPDLALPAGILMLAVGQVVTLAVLARRSDRAMQRESQGLRSLRKMTETMQAMDARLSDIEARPAAQPEILEEIAAEMRSLRDGIGTLVQQAPEPPAAEERQEPQLDIPPEALAPSSAPAPAKAQANERIELMLQPMIELSSGATLHYRALLCLTDEAGRRFDHDQVMAKAEEGGMREILDSHALKLVAPVLRRLRVRNPGMRVFVSLGSTTLQSGAGTARLLTVLEQERDIASGIVFEIAQDVLAGLDTQGIENLAQLGRLGTIMGLSNVAAAGADLPALRQLGVKFLSIPAAAFDAGFGASSNWRDFAQYARAMQFQMIATGVSSAQQASAATSIVRFGCGPFFAPPRKVKSDAGTAGASRSAFAA